MVSESTNEGNAGDASLTRGFLFADLRGYTDFVEAHGDHAAATLLERYRTLVRARVATARGAEIKTEGDSFYVVFPSAGAAVRCGLAILGAATQANADEPSRPIHVGVGVHAGETVETAEGFVGSVVNIAARICAQAKAGELVVSDTVRSLTRSYLDVAFEPLGARRLKGVDESIQLYRVVPARAGINGRVGGTSLPRLRPRLRPRLLAGVAALAVVVALAVVGATLWFRGAAPATLAPSGSAGTASTAAASPSGVPSPSGGGLSADERVLLAQIPTEFQPYCRRSSLPDGSAGGLVSLRCDLPPDFAGYGADSAWYDTFPSIAEMQLAFNGLAGHQQPPAGDCAAAATEAPGRWSLGTTFTGQLACYAKGGSAWIMWTYEGDQILVRAVRRDGNTDALGTWWHDRAADFLH